MIADRPHALYRFFGHNDELLYVGITCDLGARWTRHSEDKPWWTDVVRSTVEHYPNRPSVLEAERAAIHAEKPLHNVRMNGNEQRRTAVADASQDRSDRLSTAAASEFDARSLVGTFFLTTANPGMQGCVVAEPSPGVYLIETFSWIMGESYEQSLVRLEDMFDWHFYDSASWMNESYDHHMATRWEQERKAAGDPDWDA